jgi:hypothetical protein
MNGKIQISRPCFFCSDMNREFGKSHPNADFRLCSCSNNSFIDHSIFAGDGTTDVAVVLFAVLTDAVLLAPGLEMPSAFKAVPVLLWAVPAVSKPI